jgi:dimethylargininase
MFKFTHALVRSVPKSFNECTRNNNTIINVSKANRQHQIYIKVLKQLIPNVHCIPAEEKCPDSPFVESAAFIWRDKAILNNWIDITILNSIIYPHKTSEEYSTRKRGESIAIKKKLIDLGLNFCVLGSNATISGSDIMVARDNLLVGISCKTNIYGFNDIKNYFDFYAVPIKVPNGLVLKSVITMLDENTFICYETDESMEVMKQLINHKYNFITVPDKECTNILRIWDTVLIPEGYPKSEVILRLECKKRSLQCIRVNINEFIKVGGNLSCLSILF